MDDLGEKVAKVLSDEESMKQIMAVLSGVFGAQMKGQEVFENGNTVAESQQEGENQALPEDISKEIASAFEASSEGKTQDGDEKSAEVFAPFGTANGMELILKSIQSGALGGAGMIDKRKIRLLEALKPFIKKEDIAKQIDQAIHIAKMSAMTKSAFQGFVGGIANV